MDSVGMAFCCGATEIGSFGGGEVFDPVEFEDSVEELVSEIRGSLRTAKRCGQSVVYATTMSNQPNAAKALSSLGFYTSKPFKLCSPCNDKSHKMQAWFLPLIEYKGK